MKVGMNYGGSELVGQILSQKSILGPLGPLQPLEPLDPGDPKTPGLHVLPGIGIYETFRYIYSGVLNHRN